MTAKDAKDKDGSEIGPHLQGGNVLRIWKTFFLVVLFVLFLLLLWKAIPVLLLLFAGALVAIALRAISDPIAKHSHVPPRLSLTVVLVILIGGGAAGLYLAAPALAEQFQNLTSNLQESVSRLEEKLQENKAGAFVLDWIQGLEEKEVSGVWTRVAGAFTTTFGAITGFLLTLIVGLFLSYNPRLYVRGFLRLIPLQKRERAREIVDGLGYTLRWWMVGQLISMTVLAVSTWLMLWLLDVPLASILGILTGILTFIPYLGPLIAMVPILLVAFAQSPSVLISVLVFYLIIQNAEANVLMPIIFKHTVHLPPVLTIVAQVLLGAIFGLVGVILATPLMAAGIRLVKMIYVEDVLGDSMEEPVELEK